MNEWKTKLEKCVAEHFRLSTDPAHDLAHFKRVVANAELLARAEGAKMEIVMPAAWFHDWENVPKSDPNRARASTLSAETAIQVLTVIGYPTKYYAEIAHAIEAHSFSAQIEARTLEARVVQDADRLDGLGAIGIARLFSTTQAMGSLYYHSDEPFAKRRALDDRKYALDHFYVKLFKIAETMKTQAGRREALKRADFMRLYLDQFALEINSSIDAF